MATVTNNKDFLYLKIADGLEKQIRKGVLKVGDKLPSIRMICRQHGVSMSTAQFAFYELESRSLVDSRPQSGYYVSSFVLNKPGLPDTSQPRATATGDALTDMMQLDFQELREKDYSLFSRGVPDEAFLPVAKLSKSMIHAMRNLPGSGTSYESLGGNERLRKEVAKWSFHWKGNLSADDVITTAGCISAISYALMALTRPGDTVVVESPCFYDILRLAQSLRLKVLELPTHPQTGVELDALKKILSKKKIAACLFASNFNNPLGSLMPDEHKKEAVRLFTHHNVPLIEDDIYGELYFGDSRPACCKSFDEAGIVLLCSSFSKTLAPGYRVGWIAPGRFHSEVSKQKLYHNLYGSPINQETIGLFLESGRFEAHLRNMRRSLYSNYLQYLRVITESFPEESRVSRPQGGLSVWVQLPEEINTVDLYQRAMKQKISFTPGSLFTLQDQFQNCLRLGYGLEWTDKLEKRLRTLGKLAHSI